MATLEVKDRKKGEIPDQGNLPPVKKGPDHIEREPGSRMLKNLMPKPAREEELSQVVKDDSQQLPPELKRLDEIFSELMSDDRLDEAEENSAVKFDGAILEYVYESEINLSKLNPLQKQIQGFINHLLPKHEGKGWFNQKAGAFISALINSNPDKELTLDLSNLDKLHYVGTTMKGKDCVTIVGDVCSGFGFMAEEGILKCTGSSALHTGSMLSGATIEVGGSSGKFTGAGAKAGKIIVKGSIESLGEDIKKDVVIMKGNEKVWPKKRFWSGW